jgi:hypothetical protein
MYKNCFKIMGIKELIKPRNILIMAVGAVVFGVLANQSGILGQVGSLPQKVTSKISA